MATTSRTVVTIPPGADTELIAAPVGGRDGLYVQNRGTAKIKMSPSATTQTNSNIGITLWPGQGMDLTKGFPLQGTSGASVDTYDGAWRCWNYGPGSVDVYLNETQTV